MCMPKGEKKQLIKFVPSGNLLRDREIKFSTVLLVWQELGGAGSSWASLWESPGTKLPKHHKQDQLIWSQFLTHADAVKEKLGKSHSALQAERAGVKNSTLSFGQQLATSGRSGAIRVSWNIKEKSLTLCHAASLFNIKCSLFLSYWCKMFKMDVTGHLYL